jgi:hypothetical protein
VSPEKINGSKRSPFKTKHDNEEKIGHYLGRNIVAGGLHSLMAAAIS